MKNHFKKDDLQMLSSDFSLNYKPENLALTLSHDIFDNWYYCFSPLCYNTRILFWTIRSLFFLNTVDTVVVAELVLLLFLVY